ncbi:MAG: hypothetical protein IPJ58_18585 [Ardenticatenia bacterium]|nr:hypothetical protein [Ardenticatenia bacterium]
MSASVNPIDRPAILSRGRWAQLRVLTRQELRLRATGLWSLPPLLLAFGPTFLLLFIVVVKHLFGPGDSAQEIVGGLADWRQAFAEVFHSLMLRVCVFFGCAAVFLNSFRSAVAGRYLHYSYLSPLRRELVVAAKYLSGLIFTGIAFMLGSLTMWTAAHLDGPLGETLPALFSAQGLRLGLTYAGISFLGCVGYGAVFLALGLRFKNPIFPTLFLMVWESINLFLPAGLQKLSIIHYLQSLGPIPAKTQLISVVAAPTSAPVAIIGLLLVTMGLLWLSMRWARDMELDYGSDA